MWKSLTPTSLVDIISLRPALPLASFFRSTESDGFPVYDAQPEWKVKSTFLSPPVSALKEGSDLKRKSRTQKSCLLGSEENAKQTTSESGGGMECITRISSWGNRRHKCDLSHRTGSPFL
ncbi:hypothetical protein TGFOU_232110 [Toxoplasma gondii FOU]|uniref:Uncharacterized protein n=3 Tax=Toxoplasma gondii TaxID=5811 RepID=A0A086LFB9_TOXGO|nr:hypothetical protein TGFOU_232110 [Toxoplasma gondii FOU]PUA92690.1 hypothetical protein TGBR9_232110 [Toxoplasma gondii TgCATBr9]RQX75816.1 hypothetical protein TGCAST_232110 [Toxoplasma gondii CAST]